VEKENIFAKVQAAAAAIRDRFDGPEETPLAEVGVVLGSGLGHVASTLLEKGDARALNYEAIPHFPTSSVEGHAGQLVYGKSGETSALIMQGRVHLYEGYSAAEVIFPARVLFALGVRRILLTNAAGGISQLSPGDLMVITDHLNLTGGNPLVGPSDGRFGPRFPDMSHTYEPALRTQAAEVAKELGIPLKAGVYAGLMGPTYETPAEIRMLKMMGADAVGMSTVYEAFAAAEAGVEVLGISCITNLAAGISKEKLSHDEVKETASRVEKSFADLVLGLIPRLGNAGTSSS